MLNPWHSQAYFYYKIALLVPLVTFILQYLKGYRGTPNTADWSDEPEYFQNASFRSSSKWSSSTVIVSRFLSSEGFLRVDDVLSEPLPLGFRFAGRYAGGATRGDIYGASYYGSGYTYGSYGSAWVGGRPFPFYYWPIYIGPYEYYGASEYGPADSIDRPGGPMKTAKIYTIDPKYNTSDVYRLLGDRDSITRVLSPLRRECSITDAYGNVFYYTPASASLLYTLPHVQSIVQFYRASSFALALDGYYNSAAAVTPAALRNDTGQLMSSLLPPTPLPSGINTAFLDCINRTLGENLPIPDCDEGFICPKGTKSDANEGMAVCIRLILAAALLYAFVKGLERWRTKPKLESDQENGQNNAQESSKG